MQNVMLWAGAGQIGMAIARRMGTGMKIVAGDKRLENAQTAARTMNEAGFDVTAVEMDLSSRESIRDLIAEGQKYGEIKMLVNAAGVSPSQAPIETILKVDLYGTAVLLEEVGRVIAPGGAGVTISSQSGWRMPALTPRTGRAAGSDPGRRAAFPRFPSSGEHPRYPPLLSAGQALQRKARHGAGGGVGKARSAPERRRPRYRRHAFGAGRVQRPARQFL